MIHVLVIGQTHSGTLGHGHNQDSLVWDTPSTSDCFQNQCTMACLYMLYLSPSQSFTLFNLTEIAIMTTIYKIQNGAYTSHIRSACKEIKRPQPQRLASDNGSKSSSEQRPSDIQRYHDVISLFTLSPIQSSIDEG